ncbi:MAG: Uma2 family endonuclease [Fibrella sp.]|nr:Uma2 family endonuclease [Armatimonadota bacterium]
MTPEKFWLFARQNEGLKTEMTTDGELIAYSPTGGSTGYSNTKFTRFIDEWAEADGTGVVFDSSTLFILPNGARRSPDAAWVTNTRWNALSADDQDKPVPLAPDFALEILSPTDSLTETQTKMEEYKANGVRLGWLVDPKTRKVYVYRPGTAEAEVLDDPQTVPGDPELPGFMLDMNRVFPRRAPRS